MWHCLRSLQNVRPLDYLLKRYTNPLICRGGMIAPMLGGSLLMIDRSIPVYTSVVIFAIAGFCVLLLKEGAGDSARGRKGGRAIVH